MTSEMKDVFEETMSDIEPPLSTSTEEILVAGRRKQTRRRLSIFGGGAASLAVVGVAALMLPGLLSTPAGPDGTNSAGPEVEENGYPTPPETWEEYSALVLGLFQEQGPDLQFNGDSDAGPFELKEWGEFHSSDPDAWVEIPHSGSAFLKTADGTPVGSVGIDLYEPGEWSKEPGDDPYDVGIPGTNGPLVSCWSGETDIHQGNTDIIKVYIATTECEDLTTPQGDRMIRASSVEHYENEPPGSYTNTVVIYRADGTAVVVSSFCGNEDEDDEYGGTCQEIQFDLDQLEAIALQIPAIPITDDEK